MSLSAIRTVIQPALTVAPAAPVKLHFTDK